MIDFKEYDSSFDEDFFRFEYSIGGKQFTAKLDKYLIAKRDDNNNLTESEIEYLLEAVASFRETFLAAYVETSYLKDMAQQDFDEWYAIYEEKARDDIVQKRINLTGKTPTNSSVDIKKEEIKNYILRKWQLEYREHFNKVKEQEKMSKLLWGTYQNLISRGTELQSVLKGKRPNQFQGEIRESMI